MHYDIAIIGAGEAGVFAGYELMKLRPDLSILILEQGADIYSRRCPIVAGKVKTCIGDNGTTTGIDIRALLQNQDAEIRPQLHQLVACEYAGLSGADNCDVIMHIGCLL